MTLPWDCILYIWNFIELIPNDHLLISRRFAKKFYMELVHEKSLLESLKQDKFETLKFTSVEFIVRLFVKFDDLDICVKENTYKHLGYNIIPYKINRNFLKTPFREYINNDRQTLKSLNKVVINLREYNGITPSDIINMFKHAFYNDSLNLSYYKNTDISVFYCNNLLRFIKKFHDQEFIDLLLNISHDQYKLELIAVIFNNDLDKMIKHIKMMDISSDNILHVINVNYMQYRYLCKRLTGKYTPLICDSADIIDIIWQYIELIPREHLLISKRFLKKYHNVLTPDIVFINYNKNKIPLPDYIDKNYYQMVISKYSLIKLHYIEKLGNEKYVPYFGNDILPCFNENSTRYERGKKSLYKLCNTIMSKNRMNLGFTDKEAVNNILAEWLKTSEFNCIETNFKPVTIHVNKYIIQYLIKNFPVEAYKHIINHRNKKVFAVELYNYDINMLIKSWDILGLDYVYIRQLNISRQKLKYLVSKIDFGKFLDWIMST